MYYHLPCISCLNTSSFTQCSPLDFCVLLHHLTDICSRVESFTDVALTDLHSELLHCIIKEVGEYSIAGIFHGGKFCKSMCYRTYSRNKSACLHRPHAYTYVANFGSRILSIAKNTKISPPAKNTRYTVCTVTCACICMFDVLHNVFQIPTHLRGCKKFLAALNEPAARFYHTCCILKMFP